MDGRWKRFRTLFESTLSTEMVNAPKGVNTGEKEKWRRPVRIPTATAGDGDKEGVGDEEVEGGVADEWAVGREDEGEEPITW